jgi:tRNA threonylcarbamoyladenosine modification (KEOPS) complex  Pcc1 subunit
VTLPFDDARIARSVFGAIQPEQKTTTSGRTRVSIVREGAEISLDIVSKDVTGMRAAVNSYLRWFILAKRVAEIAGDD